jgi:PAS domain-containing protein
MLVGHSISNARGHILAVDHGICELLHRSEAELIGMSYKQITHPDDVTWNASLVDKLEASGGPLTIRMCRYPAYEAASTGEDL